MIYSVEETVNMIVTNLLLEKGVVNADELLYQLESDGVISYEDLTEAYKALYKISNVLDKVGGQLLVRRIGLGANRT
jgi:hypothetical protein